MIGRVSEKQLAIENDCPPSVDRATQAPPSGVQTPPTPPMMPPLGNFASGTARLAISTTFGRSGWLAIEGSPHSTAHPDGGRSLGAWVNGGFGLCAVRIRYDQPTSE